MVGVTTSPKALTTAEVAEQLGITRQTALNWAKKGLIPHWVLLNGHLRYDPAEIEKLRTQQFDGSAA